MRRSYSFKPTENVNMWLALAGQGVSSLGNYLFSFAMSLFVLKLTGSAQSYSITIVVSMLPMIIMSPIAGVLANKLPRKAMIVGADLLTSLLMVLMFILSTGGRLTIGMIYIFTFLKSIPVSTLEVIFTASSPQIVSAARLQKMNANRETMMAAIRIAGPILGGMLAAVVDMQLFILFTAIAFLLSAISEMFIDFGFNADAAVIPQKTEKSGLVSDIVQGISFIKANRIIGIFILYSIFLNFVYSATNVALPYILKTVIGVSDRLYGFISPLSSIATMAAAIYVNRKNTLISRKIGTAVVAIGALSNLLLASPAAFDMGLIPAVIICGVTLLLLGGCSSFVNIPAMVFLQYATPAEYLARVTGLVFAASQLFSPIGYFIFGSAIDLLGVDVVLLIVGGMMIAFGIFFDRLKSIDEPIKDVYRKKGIIK